MRQYKYEEWCYENKIYKSVSGCHYYAREKGEGVDFNYILSPVCNPELPSLYVLRSKGNKSLKEGDV